jgi:hypothetical protein
MTAFDPYYLWLGIRDAERPPNHYRLLGLDPFEEDLQVISMAADRQMAHLRTFQNGPHAGASQQLLNEVALARVCLLDAERKRVYDQQLLVKKTTDRLAAAQAPNGPSRTQAVDAALEAPEVRPRIQVASPRVAARPVAGSTTAPVVLGRPGRGNRDQLPRKLIVPIVTALLLFCAFGWWYRYQVDRSAEAPLQARRAAPPVPREPAAVEPRETVEREADDADEQLRTESKENVAEDRAGGVTSPDADTGAPVPGTPGPATPAKPPISVQPLEASRPAAAGAAPSARPASPKVAPGWNPVDLEVAVRPLSIRSTDEAAALVARLGRREVDAVRGTLNSWLKPGAVAPPSLKRDDLHLVFDLMDEFWSAVDAGLEEVQPGTSLKFKSWEVTVHEKTSTGLVLEMKTGQRHTFDTRQAAIHRDLAMALVEHHYRHSRPTAWRMTGLFLMLDSQGDVERAKDYLGRAEAEGFSTGFVLDAVRRLVGSSAAAANSLGDRPGLAPDAALVSFRALNY